MSAKDRYVNNHAGPSASGSSQPMRTSSQPSSTPSKRPLSPSATQKERDEEDEAAAEPSQQEEDELYLTTRTDVVGIQYYTGLVGKGEFVMIRRQPQNQYDANACQVLNAGGIQVGHIPRAVAARIAPLLDDHLVTVEGRMVDQNLDHSRKYKLRMDMLIYGRPSHKETLMVELDWAVPVDYSSQAAGKKRMNETGMGGGKAPSGAPDPEMQRLLEGLKRVSEDEKQADSVMVGFKDNLTANIDVTKLPLHPNPPGLANGQLLVDILPHQSQALNWMISRENPTLPTSPQDPPVQFWVRQKGTKAGEREYWLNVATRTPQEATPVLGRGGIIADGMGLGKTLTTLSLVLATKKDQITGGYSGATLIVCPLSVLSNWEKQIADHVAMGRLTSYTYHGTGKGVTASTLKEYDVVLTTYQTVAGEAASTDISSTPASNKKAKSSAGPLFKVKWKRVVADEGHQLKNPKARMSQAFVALEAEKRWVCTGTPIVNSPADLGSLLSCLHICAPLDQPAYFKSLLLRPLRNGDSNAGKLLQALVGQILLRRTKDSRDAHGNRLVELPPIEYFQCPVKLDEDTRKLYDEIRAASARRLQEGMQTGENPANVLSMLTRTVDVRHHGPAVTAASLSSEKRSELIDKLRQILANSEECANQICYDLMTNPRITVCGHAFCLDCIVHWTTTKSQNCPIDRQALSAMSLLELPPDEAPYVEPEEAPPIQSAKIDEVVKFLRLFPPGDKSLVFSQFTTFLNHVATALREAGIQFCRFDGSMPAKKRQEVIAEFQKPWTERNAKHNPVVMLISLKSGAVGLNLTAASNVFLCDPWWQSAIEAQAIDRVHRMGQRKTVRVYQLIAEDTIESKVLDIHALVAKAFDKTTKETAQAKREARFEELKELLGVK
ncbi:hypothetical protein TREMEDRAFT_60987 [Tremella mesenterica DSM 1558]|uniref:uncharacterized protein n=1 Tax=Tremella mesenterica (strain ATCC 24925 / CBS 8224 / DSM 1558 / NBRC 9311 / NRRL Y-6157 / RJB 2259-6 / UBC 559-6) TaxID=578456 RepID=UPI0003F4A469|nr:uncharacterized protein TREMEDRAFT_60987 [Tremella mesenterica DSM 1558]EIW70483.1 hypothetical protein TREMEDRAFT_60987 [Tremella mesenterica DSM 1558]